MGGKSGSSNNQMLMFEMQQAAEAKQKEAERQARLEQGKGAIDQLFNSAGFDQAFYDKYKNAELSNAEDQLQTQFDKQATQNRYSLARAGLSRSSAANQVKADLSSQKDFQDIGFRTKADQDVAALRSGIQGQQQAAYNQLYATEDPGVAATTAAGAIKSSAAAQPVLQPLGELFKPLVIGSISAGQNLLDQYTANNPSIGSGGRRAPAVSVVGDNAA
jgi:hypothetical protein